jgi:aryl-alcohol dehydrogenase-like predicted oxidoreductase
MWDRRTLVAALVVAMSMPGSALAQQQARRLFRQVPKTGERIPIVGLGTWQAFDIGPRDSDWGQAREAVATFLRSGGRMIDSSPMYGEAESAIGTILSASAGGPKPFLATKVWTSGREAGRSQIEQSFKRMQTQTIDLLQVHNMLDFATHLATLHDLKRRGRIRYIGATHYHPGGYDELERAIRSGALDFVQLNYSVGERDAERRLLPLARDSRVAVIANRPFAGGELFSTIRRKPLPPWASEIGCTSWAQLLLKYVLADSAITCAIPGTRNPRHIIDNLGAATPPLPDARTRQRILEAALG